jgi:group II intron reverse transcriptase/maturase
MASQETKNLHQAWEKVRSNKGAPGCDGQTIKQFGANEAEDLFALQEQLKAKTYRPRPVKRVEIQKFGGGMRSLGIPTVRDRIAQQAVLQILQPIFEEKFSEYSHGFRPKRGCASALSFVDQAVGHGYGWIVDADIEKFFDTVDHDILLAEVNEEIADGSVLRLIRMFLESGVMVGGGEIEATELGTPQGGPLSPLLANIYLHPLDAAMQEGGFGLVRYADDFVIFAKDRQRAEEALGLAAEILEGLKLRLHPEKTRIAAIDEGFEFLGFRYFRDENGDLQKVVSAKSEARFRANVRKRTRRHAGQKKPKPKRCTARHLKKNKRVAKMVDRTNAYVRGWHWYFKGVATSWQDYFRSFDQFVRRRLRSAIAGRYSKGRWRSILRNATLEELGLVSASELQVKYRQGLLSAPPTSG